MARVVANVRVDCRNELGEAVLWCRADNALYWVDVQNPGCVLCWHAASNRLDRWEIDDWVTGLNLIAGGDLLVHGKSRILRFNPITAKLLPLFSLPCSEASMRFNDGHCDRAGRLWVGTMPDNLTDHGVLRDVIARTGRIYAVSGASASGVDAGLGCPNAICWSPDELTFYIADSCDGWLYSYEFNAAAGTIAARKPFCFLDGLGVPDGAAVDQDGYLWNARWGAGVVARIRPDGRLDRVVDLPVSQPTSVCFGGPDLRTLFITSARFSLTAERLREEPLAGGVFSIGVDVPGIDMPMFVAEGALDR